jgi:hypothetical protein
MIVKENSVNKKYNKTRFFVLIVFVLVICIYSFEYLVSEFRTFAYDKGYRAINEDSIVNTLKRTPLGFLKKFNSKEKIPFVKIDINYNNYAKLKEKVNESFKLGFIHKNEFNEAKGSIEYNGTVYDVNIRIKGDNLDHIQGDKWSFRCKIKNEKKYFKGMKYFSIQNPKVRGFHGQLIVDDIRKKYGLIVPRRFYVNVILNGSNIGLMEVEEHFSKEMIEFNKRKEAPILKFDEDDYWKFGDSYDWTNSYIDTFQKGKTNKSSILSFYAKRATILLHGLSRNLLQPSEVFDVDEISTYLAISQFLGLEHGVRWGNVRFYYNPYIDKLQPIGYDDNFNERLHFSRIIDSPFFTYLISDTIINDSYLKKLKDLIADYDNNLIHKIIRSTESAYLEILRSEFFLLENFNTSYTDKRKDIILKKIFFERNFSGSGQNSKLMQIFYYVENNQTIFEFINTSNENIIIKELYFDEKLPVQIGITVRPNEKSFYSVGGALKIPRNFHVISRDRSGFTSNIIPYFQHRQSKHGETDDDYLESLIHEDVFRVTNNSLILNEGNWTFTRDVVVEGYVNVIIKGAMNLCFDGSGLISHSPIIIEGTKDLPIVIKGKNNGGYILVSDATHESKFNHVKFYDLSSLKTGSQILTGSISFYNSDTVIYNSTFSNNHSEDILNIIKSKFLISNVEVYSTKSDGIDLDYSNGTISESLFHSIGKTTGGDAIDLSGSEVSINDCNFTSVGDKAISIGESSLVNVSSITVSNSSVGIATKDHSVVNVSNVKFSNIKFKEMMCYTKKSQYGPAKMSIDSNRLDKSQILCQQGSSVILNGEIIKSVDVDINQLYDTIMFSDKN